MKIIDVQKVEYYIVETDTQDLNLYRRNVRGSKDSWEVLMGDSWEPTYGNNELEELFQEWLLDNNGF